MVKFRNCVINVAFESIWEDMMKSVIFGLAVAGSAFFCFLPVRRPLMIAARSPSLK